MQLQHVDTADKAKWYEIRRDELLKLLERTAGVEIPENYAQELAEIRKKCLENQFEIVLVGEFQGGKSTTFNALCDGRDLSPRGLGGGGIKTSAAIISAQNISDGETKEGMSEWAEITFKSKFEIQKGMFDLLHEDLASDKTFRNDAVAAGKVKDSEFIVKMSLPDEFARILDLDSPAHRKAVKNIIGQYWQQWEQDKSLLDEDTKDRLRIATLQERFYGTPEYQKLLEKTTVGIYDFQGMIAFPGDWIIRWQKGANADFSLKDATFVFIARTLLRIKSENLASLGCRVTDCPGLFANAYDTMVAQKAITLSDAIWYLIGGEKQIGQKDLESLDFIKQMGMDSKVTGSVNLKGKHSQKLEQVFPVTQATLSEHGFSFPVLPYNARLAFLANQGKRLVKNQEFSDYERKCMEIDSDEAGSPLEEMWISMVNDAGANTGLKELKHMDEVNGESISLVQQESRIDEIMAFLNKEIITKKSQSILIDNGSKKAGDALQEYEGKLKISEDAALQDEEKWKKAVDENKATLQKFVDETDALITDSDLYVNQETSSADISLDFIQEVCDDDFIKQFSYILAGSIRKKVKKFYLFADDLKADVLSEATPQLNILLHNTMQKVLVSWQEGKGEKLCHPHWTTYKRSLKRLISQIQRNWDNEIENAEYIKNISLSLPSESEINWQITNLSSNILDSDKMTALINSLSMSSIEFLWNCFWSATGGVLIKVLTWIWNFIMNEPPQPKGSDEAERAREERLTQKLADQEVRPKIRATLESCDFHKQLSKQTVGIFGELQDKVFDGVLNSVRSLVDRFQEEHVDPAKRNFSEAESKRKEIAEQNHQIRVTQIEPLRKEIQAFEQQVSAELKA